MSHFHCKRCLWAYFSRKRARIGRSRGPKCGGSCKKLQPSNCPNSSKASQNICGSEPISPRSRLWLMLCGTFRAKAKVSGNRRAPSSNYAWIRHSIMRGVEFNSIELDSVMFQKILLPRSWRIPASNPGFHVVPGRTHKNAWMGNTRDFPQQFGIFHKFCRKPEIHIVY